MSEPLGVGADLMLAAGEQSDPGEGVTVGGHEGFKDADGFLRGAGAANGLLDVNRPFHVTGQLFIYLAGAVEFAFEDRVVDFAHIAALQGALAEAGHAPGLCNDDDSAGFAIEAADEVELVRARVFAACSHKAGERAFLRGMAYDPAGFIYDEQFVVLMEYPLLKLGEVDERRFEAVYVGIFHWSRFSRISPLGSDIRLFRKLFKPKFFQKHSGKKGGERFGQL